MLWKLNDVSDWLDKKTEKEREALIRAVAAKKFRDMILH